MHILIQVINFLKTRPKLFAVFVCCVVIGILLFLPLLGTTSQSPGVSIVPPTPVPGIPTVTSTYPENGQENVPRGEIEIIVHFAAPIPDKDQVVLEFSPQLPYYYKIENDFPSSILRAKIFGGTEANTNYTVRVKTNTNKELYNWGFITSADTPQSSSGLVRDEDEEFIKQYLPLAPHLPYSTSDFSVEYTNRLTLKVTMKNSDKTRIEQEVVVWMQSKGVDPSTHTIEYVNI